ncbi:hypothetical protein ES705_15975 [subsurface metagenome]
MSEKKSEKKIENRGKSHKNPTTRVISVPAQFLPLIERERERRGYFSQHECMGRILKDYFGTNGLKAPESGKEEILKGVKINA